MNRPPDADLRRLVRLFFLWLCGWCLLLMVPWPGLKAVVGRAFVHCANVTAEWLESPNGIESPTAELNSGLLGSPAKLKLIFVGEQGVDVPPDLRGHDVEMKIGNAARAGTPGSITTRWITSRHLAYMPAAMFAALVLASPVPRRRKGWALAVGLPLCVLFVVLRFGILVLYAFQGQDPHCLYTLTGLPQAALDGVARIVAREPASSYLIPVLMWMPLTFRAADLALLGLKSGRAHPRGGPGSS